MLKHEGHCYIFDKASKSDPEIMFWRCERKHVCKARLHFKNNEILKVLNKHSHETAPHRIDYRTVATSLKNRAEKTQESPCVILNESLKSVEQASLALLGNRESLRKVVRRKRLNFGKKNSQSTKLSRIKVST